MRRLRCEVCSAVSRAANPGAPDATYRRAARQVRNALLFAPKTGMIDTALAVKEYVKAAFGAKSPEYREVNHISFRNRKI